MLGVLFFFLLEDYFFISLLSIHVITFVSLVFYKECVLFMSYMGGRYKFISYFSLIFFLIDVDRRREFEFTLELLRYFSYFFFRPILTVKSIPSALNLQIQA